jgi:hypothetical protein
MARPIRLRIARGPLLALLLTTASVEIVWTIYLGLRLPRHYVANHWDLAWVGLDVAETAMMFLAAWAAWRRRAVFIIFASVSATFFLVDAWFDITTARRGDLWLSGLVAAAWEVPLALGLLWIAGRAIRRLSILTPSGEAHDNVAVHQILLSQPPRDVDQG